MCTGYSCYLSNPIVELDWQESFISVIPHKQFTDLVLPEIYRGLTNDSHPDFGEDLAWNPAHGPRGPPLKRAPLAAPLMQATRQWRASAPSLSHWNISRRTDINSNRGGCKCAIECSIISSFNIISLLFGKHLLYYLAAHRCTCLGYHLTCTTPHTRLHHTLSSIILVNINGVRLYSRDLMRPSRNLSHA